MRCACCHTEFRIDFKEYEGVGTAVFITKWKDFGQGRSFLDPKWQNQTDWKGGEEVEFERGSICAAFEGQPSSKFEFEGLISPWIERSWLGRTIALL